VDACGRDDEIMTIAKSIISVGSHAGSGLFDFFDVA
jgi:hypothetical protein